MSHEPAEVNAAGGAVVRSGPGATVEIVLVHRPRYDDWSLPKGKLDDGEDFADAALREVREEANLHCRLGSELQPTRYTDHKGRAKLVRYWLMEVESDDGFEPDDEVDELRWVDPLDAAELLSYEHDRALVRGLGARLQRSGLG